MNNTDYSDLTINAYTDNIIDTTLYGTPAKSDDPGDIIKAIQLGATLEERPVFLEGLAERLTSLGTPCSKDDTEEMLSLVKARYKRILKKSCPRTVTEWIKGTTPGTTNRRNNFELCYSLEMDCKETSTFFQKHFLTIPYIYKSSLDSIFFFCLLNKKPYSTAEKMLKESESFTVTESTDTVTARIRSDILEIKDEDEFLEYISKHCYTEKQQFMLAKSLILKEVETIKENLLQENEVSLSLFKEISEPKLSPDRLNRLTIFRLLGYKYEGRTTSPKGLPKRFTESLPNDVTLGKILNGEAVTYELLRKTLMLLKFHNFYHDADNATSDETLANLLDFKEELNKALDSCGFSLIYMGHPFDCMLMYCANSNEPIETFHSILEYSRN